MRELLHQAIQHHDQMVTELETTKRELEQYRRENETLLNEVAAAANKIQELEASQKHIQTVMSARVVTAAVDIVEEFSKRALNEVKDKAEAKLADLFRPGPTPKPVDPIKNADARIDEFIESLPPPVVKSFEQDVDPYAPKKSFKQRLAEKNNGAAIPEFLANPIRNGVYKEPDSLVRRIIFAFIGG